MRAAKFKTFLSCRRVNLRTKVLSYEPAAISAVLIGLIILITFTLGCTQKEAPKEDSGVKNKEASHVKSEPAYGDAIIEGSIGDASNLIPELASDSASHEIADLVYGGLVRYNKDLITEGVLAESWDVSDGGLVITFHLRKDVSWHDGKPFTADDVMYTYKVMIDPKTPTAYGGDFLQVKKAEVLDKYTFRVTYKKPFAPGLISWSIGILPSHLLMGKDITKSSLARNPIGTGSYKFKEWKTGEKIVLESNHNYFEGRPYIDRFIYRIIPDSATMFLELKAGGIDWMGLAPFQYKRQTENAKIKKNFNKFKYLSFSYTYLGFNLLDPRFKDKRVRQAISYAINKQELIDGVLLGLGVIATGPYKPDMWAYNPNVKKYEFSTDKAKELLNEAGWKNTDKDGILEKNGKKFEFTILTNQGNEEREKSAQIIQRRLKDAGISVKIRIVEWSAFLKEFIRTRKFEAIILGWNIPPDPDLFDVWHSSKTGPDELNHVTFKNAEVDRLLVKGRETFDQEERKKCYFRIQEIFAEEQPYVFLYVPDALPIVNARFKNINPAPAGISYNFIKWYVPKNEQKYVELTQ